MPTVDRPPPPDVDDVVAGLSYAVFGFPGDPSTGLLGRAIRVEQKLDDLIKAAVVAAVTFGTGSIGISLTIALT